MVSSLLTLLPLVLAPSSSNGGSSAVTYADETFADGDWQTTSILVGPGTATVTGLQVQAGNPAPAYRVTHSFVAGGGATSIYVLHLMTAAVYDPTLEGPIGELHFSLDLTAAQGGPQRCFAGLEQDGKLFLTGTATALTGGGWATIGPTALAAADFGERLPDGTFDANSKPDFSASGSPITFGFETENGNGGTTAIAADYDNFRVDVNGVVSTSVVRLGSPPNPNALLPGSTSGPVIGAAWDPIIDHTSFAPAAAMDIVVYSSAPGSVTTNYGTFLCAQIEDGMAVSAGTPFSFPVPNDFGLIGVSLCFQGGSFDPVQGPLLTNALDVTIGTL